MTTTDRDEGRGRDIDLLAIGGTIHWCKPKERGVWKWLRARFRSLSRRPTYFN